MMGIGDDLMAMGDGARLRADYPVDSIIIAIGDGTRVYTSPLHQNIPWLCGERIPSKTVQARAITKEGNLPYNVKWVISHPGNRPYCDYERMIATAQKQFNRIGGMNGQHAFALLRRKFWKADYHPTPAPLILTKDEFKAGEDLLAGLKRPVVLIEPNLKLGAPENKRWPFGRYQKVVNARCDRCTFVQFGRPILSGAVQLPPMVIRSALGALAAVDVYLGAEGGLHHAAAALGKPAVVVFGGYINPLVTGYSFHQNLFVECEDEGVPGPTPAGEAALAAISVEQVVAALDLITLDMV